LPTFYETIRSLTDTIESSDVMMRLINRYKCNLLIT